MLTGVVDDYAYDITWNAGCFSLNMDNIIVLGASHHTIICKFLNHDRQNFSHIQPILLQADFVLSILKAAQPLRLHWFIDLICKISGSGAGTI